jgi:cell division protein FtsL
MRGRSLIFLALLGFFVVATGVIWRRSIGIATARQLRELEERRSELEAQEAALEGAIRDASSRARLAPIAEQQLGMRIPPESLVIIIPRPDGAPPTP